MIPDSNFLLEDEVNEEIRKIVMYYMNNDTVMNRGKTKSAFITFYNNLPPEDRDADWVAIRAGISDEAFIEDIWDDYVIYLMSSSPAEQHLGSIDIFATDFIRT